MSDLDANSVKGTIRTPCDDSGKQQQDLKNSSKFR